MLNSNLLTNILTLTIKPKYKLNELYHKNKKYINREYLSKNPNAIHILEKNLDKINWNYLSKNPNTIHILEKYLDKVWWNLYGIPNINQLIYNLHALSSFKSFNNYL